MKLESMYNLKSLDVFADNIKGHVNQKKFTDSLGGLVLSENLTKTDPRLLEKKYPGLVFVNSGVDFENSGGYASRIESLRVVDQGDFVLSEDRNQNKAQIKIKAEKSFLDIEELGAGTNWTDTDVNVASMQGINLVSKLMEAINKVYLRKLDAIGLVGLEVTNGVTGSKGLLNSSDFTATASGSLISALTSQEKYDAIADLITDQSDAVSNTDEYRANKVIMATRVYNDLKKTSLDTSASTDSVLAALKKNFTDIEFVATYRADTIANGGSLASSATVAYNTSNESMLFRLPKPLDISETIKTTGFTSSVEARFRVGGLDVLEPSTGRILTGL